MNKFKKEINRKATKLILIGVLIMAVAMCLVIHKANAQEVNYVICIDDGDLRNVANYKSDNLTKVADLYFIQTGQTLDTTKVFTNKNVYFQFRTGDKIFYCEKKKVVRKGGKRKLKPIKRKEVHKFNIVRFD